MKIRIAALILGFVVSCTSLMSAQAVQYSPMPRFVPTGGTHPYAGAINTVTNRLYVANSTSNTVSVLDVATLAPVTAPIEVDPGPAGVAVNPQTNRIYVSHYGAFTPSGTTVKVIDGSTNQVIDTINTGGIAGIGIGVDPTSNKIFVANFGSNFVSVIDGTTGSVSQVVTGLAPLQIAVNKTTNKVYVANYGAQSISVLNSLTGSLIKTIDDCGASVDARHSCHVAGPWGMAVNEATNKVYVAMNAMTRVTTLDGATDELCSSEVVVNNPCYISITGGLTGVSADPVHNRIVVSLNSTNSTAIYNAATGARLGSVTTGVPGNSGVIGSVVDPRNGNIYALNPGANTNSWGKYFWHDPTSPDNLGIVFSFLDPLSIPSWLPGWARSLDPGGVFMILTDEQLGS